MGSKHTQHLGRHQLVERLTEQVGSRERAISILQSRGDMDASGKLTKKGAKRDSMTAGERAIDRASKASGRPKASYKYNPRTNSATLKRR